MTSNAKASIKLVFINLLVLFTLANLFYWAIPAANALHRASDFVFAKFDKRAAPEKEAGKSSRKWNLLSEFSWGQDYQREWDELKTSYYSYVAWRRQPFAGKTINIAGPYNQRRTLNEASDQTNTVYFFGGSTVWGTGADDAGTIPSLFAQASGVFSENFGEAGYTAHQNLVFLIQLLQDGRRPSLVVFYSGVNEVNNKCRSELTPTSHGREQQIRTVLASPAISRAEQPNTFRHYMEPLVWLGHKVHDRVAPTQKGFYDCDSDPTKAEAVARNLIKDWDVAKLLVEANGGKFIGILQPAAHYTKSPIDHLKLGKDLEAQYHAVYPKMRAMISGSNSYFDFNSILDTDLRVFMDVSHITPHGNRIVAAKIAEIVAPWGFAPLLQAKAQTPRGTDEK